MRLLSIHPDADVIIISGSMRILHKALFFALTFFVADSASAQWVNQAPKPTELDVRGVAAPTPDRVFLATSDDSFDDGGALWDSEDGGATWTQRAVPFSLFDPLNGIFFLDSQNGWTFGNDNYRTTDGGDTWEELPFLGSTYFMEFYTSDFGFTVTNGDNWISQDGGLSWEVVPNGMFAFDFADDLLGLGVSESGIYRTTDGGDSFNLVSAGDGEIVAFLSSTLAVAIVDGSFAHSTDGGQTWSTGSMAEGRNRLLPLSADVILAWARTGTFGDDARVFRSADGGQTWTDLGDVLGEGAHALIAPDASTVVAIDSEESMFRSTDGGLSWAETYSSPGPSATFFSSSPIAFADASNGYAGYGAGFVIKTTDGGATWSQVSSGVGNAIYGIDRFPDGRLVAVGASGTVLTNTGLDGAPWVVHQSLSSQDLQEVIVVGEDSAVAVDEEGFIYTTNDGAATWTASVGSTGDDAYDLHFETLSEGWVVGSVGSNALFHTIDGGASWTPVGGFGGLYVAVDFEGENGWIAGAGEFYRRSTDGGATWSEILDVPGSTNLNDMDFWNENVGYAVGWFGFAARSEDGGVTWEVLELPEGNEGDQIRDLHLLGENELWMTTTANRAYYSSNGGTSWTTFELPEGTDSYYGITASPDGDAWTVGWEGHIEHFMGPPGPAPNLPPVASFEVTIFGLQADFTDTSTDADGTIVGHAWDFGDGATSTEQHPSHTFAAEGFYDVLLTVTDDDGATGDRVQQIFVKPIDSTFGDFTEVTPAEYPFITQEEDDFWVASTAPADYDADGDLDIAVLGYYVLYNESVDYQLLLFKNEGEGPSGRWQFEYVEVPLGEMTTGASDMAWSDLDADGDEDLIVGSEGQTALYRNEAGTLVLTGTVLPGYYEYDDFASFDLRSITWADYDNDGDQDLLMPSVYDDQTFSFRTALLRNDGDDGTGSWLFVETDSTFADTKYAQSAWVDFDGDNDLDLLLVDTPTDSEDIRFIRLYVNEGNGVFSGEDLFDGLTIQTGNVLWQDYDGDGDYDFLVAGSVFEPDNTFHTVLRIYRNDGEEYAPITLVEGPIFDDDNGLLFIVVASWADYDSDGDIDILVAGEYNPNDGNPTRGRAKIFLNESGVFTLIEDNLPAPRASSWSGGAFSWLDMDNDGDLDYFIAGEYWVPGGNGLVEAQMHVYRNDAAGQNAAPTMPTNLNASVDEENRSVTLSWNPAGDDSTPVAALTYDLSLYLNDIPLDLPHHLPEPGSVSAVTDWAFGDLVDGTYNWTIRAVDNAFLGGPLAQGTFNIGVINSNGPDALPRVYSFDGTYPNPFNTSTIIRYGLPEAAEVDIAVFDILGRMVTRLVQDDRPAGFHEVQWDAPALASGTYLVRFSTDAFTATRRIQLLR